MAHFEGLPSELLTRVICFLDKKSLAQVRLVNKRLEQISVERLFAKITLYAHWKKKNSCANDEEETDCVDSGRAEADDEVQWTIQDANHRDYEDETDGVEVSGDDQLSDTSMSDRHAGAPETDHVAWASLGGMPRIEGRNRANEDRLSSSVSRPRSPVGGRRRYSTIPSRSSSPAPRRRRDSSSSPPRRRIDSAPVEPRRARAGEVECLSGDSDSLEDAEENSHLDESDQEDLKWESRPTSRKRSATSRIPQWASDGLPGPPYDARMFKNILQDATFKKHVREVQIYTCNTNCDFHPAYAGKWYRGDMPEPEFDPVYNECIERLGEFTNVRNITIHFDRHASGNHSSYGEIFQDSEFQPRWLSRILRSVDACNHATELAVRHYENTLEPNNEVPLLFESVAKLTSLRLSIKHEETNRLSVGPTYRCGNIHPFWNRFSARFLEPSQQDFTTLVLYSDLPLGWFPKLDLRKVHFPKLRSLTLGQHIFHHDHQVDWIISHSSTLKELYLDRCSILYHIGHGITEWLDEGGYPKEDPGDYGWSSGPEHVQDDAEFSRSLQFVSISLRWHVILSQFAEKLHVLQDFKFGSSKQWKIDTDSRYIEQGCQTGGLPIMPWEDEKNIENQILETRYMIWDDMEQIYRPKWTSDAGVYNNDKSTDEFWRDEWKARFEPYPDCKEADEAALQTLLNKIKGR